MSALVTAGIPPRSSRCRHFAIDEYGRRHAALNRHFGLVALEDNDRKGLQDPHDRTGRDTESGEPFRAAGEVPYDTPDPATVSCFQRGKRCSGQRVFLKNVP